MNTGRELIVNDFYAEMAKQLESGAERYGTDVTLKLIDDIDSDFYVANIIKYASRVGHHNDTRYLKDLVKIATYAYLMWKRCKELDGNIATG
jgi:hypothetical protein